jgi:hypothetical protein
MTDDATSDEYPVSLLHLPSIPVPPEALRVEGCSCGGLDLHPMNCTIFRLPSKQAQEAIAAVSQRLRERSAALTRQLMREHAELATLRGPEERP